MKWQNPPHIQTESTPSLRSRALSRLYHSRGAGRSNFHNLGRSGSPTSDICKPDLMDPLSVRLLNHGGQTADGSHVEIHESRPNGGNRVKY